MLDWRKKWRKLGGKLKWQTQLNKIRLYQNRIYFLSCTQQLQVALLVTLSVSQSTKIPHSLAAAVFILGGWNLARRSRVWRCVCVHDNWLKGGMLMEVAYCKKVHNFQMDLQTCTRFSGKDSRLTVWANWQKRGRGSESRL